MKSKVTSMVGRNPAETAASTPERWVTNPMLRCLDVEETARYLGIRRRSVWSLVQAGRLRVVRLPGIRRALFDRVDLDKLIEAGKADA